MAQWSIASLIKTGFSASNIILITDKRSNIDKINKNVQFKIVKNNLSKHVKHWFYKPLAYSEGLKDAIPNSFVIMSDIDVLFFENPVDFFLKQETDIWSRGRERFLRESRLSKLKPNEINPSWDNFKDLSGYMGRTRAYLLSKYGPKVLPEFGLYSDLVSISSAVYTKLISTWRKMYDDVITTPYFQGDQQVLCSAMRYLGLSYSSYDFNGVKHYQSKEKKSMILDAKKLGL